MDEQAKVDSQVAPAADARMRRLVTYVSALVLAVAFQAKTMAYYNYSLWRFEFTAIEVAVAILMSMLATRVFDLDERGRAWAQSYVSSDTGLLYELMSILPSAAARAALVCAGLSVANVAYVAPVIYREDVGFIPAAIVVRFLADYPQAVLLCVVVVLVLRWRAQRNQASR